MYCCDVIVYFNNFIFSEKCEFKFLVKFLRVLGECWYIDYVMEEVLDCCFEICYVIDKFV